MGTTNRPLEIWVQEKWAKRKEVRALEEKGHTVKIMDECDADLIIHENAWRWHDAYWEHIGVALKEARRGQPKKTPASDVPSRKVASRKRSVRGVLQKELPEPTP